MANKKAPLAQGSFIFCLDYFFFFGAAFFALAFGFLAGILWGLKDKKEAHPPWRTRELQEQVGKMVKMFFVECSQIFRLVGRGSQEASFW